MHAGDPVVRILLLVLGALVAVGGCAVVVLFFASTRVTAVEGRSFGRTVGIAVLSILTAVVITSVCHSRFQTSVSATVGLVASAAIMTLLNVVLYRTTLLKAVETMLVTYFLFGFTIAASAVVLWASGWIRI